MEQIAGMRRLRRRATGAFWTVVPLVVLVALWQVLVSLATLPTFVLPAPLDVFRALVERREVLLDHGITTGTSALIGFGLAVAVGVPLGWLIVSFWIFRLTLYPSMVGMQAVPKIALGPLFIAWFGFGTLPKVLLSFLITFFPIAVAAAVGFSALPSEWFLLTRSMRASRWQTFLKLQLPAALPAIFGGLKVGAALAIVGVTVGEFIGSDRGVGYLLLLAASSFDAAMEFAALFVLASMGIALYGVVSLLEKSLIPWKEPNAAEAVGGTA